MKVSLQNSSSCIAQGEQWSSETIQKNEINLKSQTSRSVFTMSRFMLIGIVTLALFAAGCDKENDDDNSPTTVKEDKENIQASFDRTKNLLENFTNGSFGNFINQFVDYHEEYVENYYYHSTYDYYSCWNGSCDYSYNDQTGKYDYTPGVGNYERSGYAGDYSYNPQTGKYDYTPGAGDYRQYDNGYYDNVISEFTEMLGEKLADIVDFDQIGDDNRFNFAKFAGKYTWNNSGNRWVKTSDKAIVALFPSSKDKKSNDCEAAITAYEDNRYDIEGNNIYLPTQANAYFKKDGETLFSANVTASFSSYGIPKQATADVYAKPLKFGVSFAQESASKFKADVKIEDETQSENNLVISCEAALSGGISRYSDFDDIAVNVLKFNVKQHELSIVGTVDFKTLNELRQTATNINGCTDFEVFYRDKKVGTLEVVDLDNDKQYLYIVYKDGTKENTSMYYDTFVADIEKMFEKYWKQ